MLSALFVRSSLLIAVALPLAACSDNGQLLGQRAAAGGAGAPPAAGTGGKSPSAGGSGNLAGGGGLGDVGGGAAAGASTGGSSGSGAGGANAAGAGGQANPCDETRNQTPGVVKTQATDVGLGECAGVTLADAILQVRALRPDLADVTVLFTSDAFTDGSFIYAFQRADGGFALAFKRGSGDCLAGCIQNDYWYFETGAGCKVEQIGEAHPTHTGACVPAAQLPRWGVPPEAQGITICDAATACPGTGGGGTGNAGSGGTTSSGGGGGTANAGSAGTVDRGGTCNTGCTTNNTSTTTCVATEVLWQCSNQAELDYMARNCRDAGTDLPRYCCPAQFLQSCAPTI